MDRRPPYSASVPVNPADGQISSHQPLHVFDADQGPQTIHRSDTFFIDSSPRMTSSKMPSPKQPNTAAPTMSAELYPYHQQAFQHHFSPPAPLPSARPIVYAHHPHPQDPPYYEYRQRAASAPARPPPSVPPPLPPKPIVYPVLTGSATLHEFSPYIAPRLRSPPPLPPPLPPPIRSPLNRQSAESSIEDCNELAIVLAISQSESAQKQILEEQLRQKEEEDLAKALAESVLTSEAHRLSSNDDYFGRRNDDALVSEVQYDRPGVEERLISENPVSNHLSRESETTAVLLAKDLSNSDSTKCDNRHQGPGFSLLPVAENGLSGRHAQQEVAATENLFSSHDPSTQASGSGSSRPSSVYSVSSLPYTQPSPKPNVSDSTELGQAYTTDNDESSLRPSSHTVTTPAPESVSIADSIPETVLVFDDEAFARQLAAEEEELSRQAHCQLDDKNNLGGNGPPEGPDLTIHPILGVQDQTMPRFSGPSHWVGGGSSSRPILYPSAGSAAQYDLLANPSPSTSEPSFPSSVSSVAYPSLGHHREIDSDAQSEASHYSSSPSHVSATTNNSDSRPTSSWDGQIHSHLVTSSVNALTSSPGPLDGRVSGQAPHLPSLGVLNANHFLDRELLMGVSIGFTPPPISTRLVLMRDPMPNIISLPYARCPPLHLQAPDWMHLLRLMARLSGTRIEPTVEAMAISKTDLKLRTVVQFVKPHPSSSEWRTIVWFTIDHPIPPSTPGASRYLSGNPNLLPWSYTLSPVPMLLRDAHDTHLSKTYTIPASDALPLPTLPITFPNLALYLQAALDFSRRHSNDGLTGVGKLGKVVQTCYPYIQQSHSEFDIPERSTVGHLFKRVIGRGGKDRKKGKGTNNEETYQLVTPFVPDEWG